MLYRTAAALVGACVKGGGGCVVVGTGGAAGG